MQIVVCGQHRTGTSMLMRMLQLGGITVVYTEAWNSPETLAKYRNPYGMFELLPPPQVVTGNYKELRPYKVATLPADVKLIFANRSLDGMAGSWAVIDGGPIRNSRLEMIQKIGQNLAKALAGKTYLELDYDETCADPQSAAGKIATFLGPDVSFDAAAAASAVDKSLYINRSAVKQ